MLNNITLNGRLTMNPAVRETKDGIMVADFSIACEQDFKNAQGEKVVDFFDCAVWRQGAEYIKQYGSKGDMVSISGRMKTEYWQDKEGKKRKSYKVQVERIYIVARKLSSESQREYKGGDHHDLPPQNYGNGYYHGGYLPPQNDQEPPENYEDEYNYGRGYQEETDLPF